MHSLTAASHGRIRSQFTFARNTVFTVGADDAAPAAVFGMIIGVDFDTITQCRHIVQSGGTLSLIAVLPRTACMTTRTAVVRIDIGPNRHTFAYYLGI